MQHKRIIISVILLLLVIFVWFFFFGKFDCSKLLAPSEIMDACGNTLGNEEKWPWWRSRLQGDEVCGQAWYSSPFGGDLKIFSILVHHANYYPVALDFDREIAKRPTYGDYVVTEINEFGEASYVLENRGMNKITFKQSAYTIDIFAPKGFCSLDQLKTLSRIAEKRIS